MSTIDSPFMETKEVLGVFILIEARDLNDLTSGVNQPVVIKQAFAL
jgi:hypothetical protein